MAQNQWKFFAIRPKRQNFAALSNFHISAKTNKHGHHE